MDFTGNVMKSQGFARNLGRLKKLTETTNVASVVKNILIVIRSFT